MESIAKKVGLKRKILIVDDEFINQEILKNIFSQEYDVDVADDGVDALEKIKSGHSDYSLVLLDLIMPNKDGFSVLHEIKSDESLSDIPVIVMTSEKDAELKSIKDGAADFITKPYDMPEIILARCERIIELSEKKNLISLTEKDSLTGLYTKDFFFEYVRQLESYDPKKKMDALALNIDHFNLINGLHGRTEGDNVLKRISSVLKDYLKNTIGISCRLEADTFFIFVEHPDDPDANAKNMTNAFREEFKDKNIRIRIGIYTDVDKSLTPETWFEHAYMACNLIRSDYTKHYSFYSHSLHEKSLFHERLINDIDDGIKNKDFIVFYQPKYNIQSDTYRLSSAEALIRWKHPELGMISPGEFIPLFENNGLIQRLDHYVWNEAASQIKKWKEEYGIKLPVSVNVSRIDIYDENLESSLMNILSENDLEPKDLMLEITESAYSEDARKLIEVVNNLRSLGFMIEMDDFGSGYSSLNMLTSIPIDVLKMDMKFIRNMHKDETSLRLVEMILDIAKFLKVPVVAEGVEEEAQIITLKERGCDIIQGFFFSKPVPPDEFGKFIEKEKSASLSSD